LHEYSKSTAFSILIGAIIVIGLFSMMIFGPFILSYGPLEIGGNALAPPSLNHLMGTDSVGRDVLSRIMWGGRYSFLIAMIAVGMSSLIGTFSGIASGYVGGKIDRLLTLLVDCLYAFPIYIMAVTVAAILGPTVVNLAFSVGIAYIPRYFKVMRSIALSVKEKMFIEAEKCLGAGSFYIIYHHILPYIISSTIVLISMGVAQSILMVSGLGFLGIGIQAPTPEWGTDLSSGRNYFFNGAWWVVFFPGLMIFLAVLGFNLLGEGLNAIFQERGVETYGT
jgi:peptide/nickel transport system permease protein